MPKGYVDEKNPPKEKGGATVLDDKLKEVREREEKQPAKKEEK